MRVFGWVLVGLFVLLLVYLFIRRKKTTEAAAEPSSTASGSSRASLGSPYQNIVTGAENALGKAFGIPSASTALDTAAHAPTWLKIAVPAVALNGAVQTAIRSPPAAARAVAGATVGAVKAVGGATATAARTVGGAASSVGHAIASIF